MGFQEVDQVKEVEAPFADVDWETSIVLSSQPPPIEADPSQRHANAPPRHFVLSRKACQLSSLLSDLTAPESGNGPGEETIIPVQGGGEALRYTVAYLETHFDARSARIPRPLEARFESGLSEIDRRFVEELIPTEMDHERCVDVICIANYLSIEDLLDLTTAALGGLKCLST